MQTRKPLIVLFSLFLICALPVVGAYILYYLRPDLPRDNHGTLLKPTIPLADLAEVTLEPKHWWFVYVEPGPCDATCQKDIVTIRQVRLALGVDTRRVNRLLVMTHLQPNLFKHIEQPDLISLSSPLERISQLASKANLPVVEGLYVADPQGRIMMHFGANLEPKPIYKDMKRLLKYG